MTVRTWDAAPIPAMAGIGLRFPHHRHVAEAKPAVPWYEVHPENYMAGGGPLRWLELIRRDRPISFHAVGLSLGSASPSDPDHLARLSALIAQVQPALVSDHLSWSAVDGTYLADLLPLPYTGEALEIVSANVRRVQDTLGRQILVENPSTYLAFAHSDMSEPAFLAELVHRTGCGILCDVNNIHVSSCNLGGDGIAYLDALPAHAIGEIHLAGHAVKRLEGGGEIRIDDHGSAVSPAVWDLYAEALARFGPAPTLIEWDTNIPEFAALETQAAIAQHRLDMFCTPEARHARSA